MMLPDTIGTEVAGVIVLWLANIVGLALVDAWAGRRELHPESARKLVHVSAGLLATPIPWLIQSSLSMVVLAAGGLVGLVLARRFRLLRSIHGVERTTAGDILFPLGIALLFFVGHDDPPAYLIGLSFLVVSDALAALVGRRYGRSSFAVERHRRSVEGSITFFVVSFLAAHLILLLGTPTPRLSSVLIAAQLALLATCFEAISLEGNDNVLIPLVTSLVVMRLVELPVDILARDLTVQVAIGVLVAWMTSKWRFAGVTGAVVLGLFLYGAYALGGAAWIMAPLMALTTYVALRRLHSGGRAAAEGHHQVTAMFYVTVVAAGLYLAAATFRELVGVGGATSPDRFMAPYLGAVAGQLSILVYTLWRPWDAPMEALDPGLVPGLLAVSVMAPLALVAHVEPVPASLWIFGVPLLALGIYRKIRNGSAWPRAVPWNSRLQAVAVASALALVAPIQLILFP